MRSIFSYLWKIINGTRKVILNLVFFLILAVFLVSLFSGEDPIEVPENGILVLNPNGMLVEEKTWVDPFSQFLNEAMGSSDDIPEVLLSDVVDSIEKAKTDERIGALYLNLQNLYPSGLNKLQAVAEALDDFRTSGKPIISNADYYDQHQYYLAAHADQLYLNPMGGVVFEGLDYTQLYFKDLLDKLKVQPQVFKVGKFKAAVEPFIRNDMSDEAREANEFLYSALWDSFRTDVTAARNINPLVTSGKVDDYMSAFNSANGDMAKMALETNMVDALRTRTEVRNELINLAGYDKEEDTFRHITYDNYLATEMEVPESLQPTDRSQIAVVVARGQIVNGSQKAGMIGGDSTAKLIREARNNKQTKAIVLRIDSPGGSAFASEIIRQEILQAKEAGIPVVASMSTVAASGGYWIAADADKIVAAPTTITGSIGVFGLLMTLEDSLAAIGVHSDTVSTTEIQGLNPLEEMTEYQKKLVQSSVEATYEDFLTIVSKARNMSRDDVHEVAQGRIWTGKQAMERGLVDQLGDFDDSVAAAAELAAIDDYDVKIVQQELSSKEQFFANMFNSSSEYLPVPSVGGEAQHWLMGTLNKVKSETAVLQNFNDPKNVYSYCALCLQPR
ncbi:MAG: signal peptide peptidase SppA [Idiomarinaceae bacterium]|jgi:protease-4|uniref:Periplasmic serine protease, ClpP family n=1 Tax=Idiomarina loihiensis (strain ATCC BAA-735 / DSM 15497 / L2-TR) TaxID=283942 RepID=Q5QZ26_IDILO|nr:MULTISPECIES: signal peptide peptidase SppA [Idiomarina]NWO04069.1 signal peptide peptidase SppA [Idiomarinaceae bacterium]AAV82169.1 Periplasmic serine protease, ClpP family [Idiomarina loihiensis L2TR]AGM36199.1 serine protease [Idiomarina loihiensis GSL 199]MBL4856427.1 signal peptide peptidase SppA [Idiomarina sp.]PHQ88510.1 MAG: signal peptide peptidase SppA [Idiomarina sp.]|tara:strand:- start:3399 stop:5249 length:1851 start_codon:yes stop_codon:yes gene_type:complete